MIKESDQIPPVSGSTPATPQVNSTSQPTEISKFKEFENAVLQGIAKADEKSSSDGERSEPQTMDSPGVEGWAEYRNDISFNIPVKLQSKEDLQLFKNYVFGYDEQKDQLIPTVFEDVLDSPSSHFYLQTLDSDYVRSHDGWVEAYLIIQNGIISFKGTYISSTLGSDRFIDFADWSEKQDIRVV